MKWISLLLFILLLNIQSMGQTYLLERPDPAGQKTEVEVGIYILDVISIDSKKQSFTVDIIVRLRWKDHRINPNYKIYPKKDIWDPNILFYNVRNTDEFFPEFIKVKSGNVLEYTQRYNADLSSQLDFAEFPMDKQNLIVKLMSFGYSPDEVELKYDNFGLEKSLSITDWKINSSGYKLDVFKASLDDDTEIVLRPAIEFQLTAQRYVEYYWWKIVGPLILIIALSWAVFWIDPSQVGAQIGVSGTSILTLIAFLLRLEGFLPPVSYLTRMDHFIIASLALVFIAYLEALISTTFALNERKALALRMDFIFRIVYPVAFLIVILVFWTT